MCISKLWMLIKKYQCLSLFQTAWMIKFGKTWKLNLSGEYVVLYGHQVSWFWVFPQNYIYGKAIVKFRAFKVGRKPHVCMYIIYYTLHIHILRYVQCVSRSHEWRTHNWCCKYCFHININNPCYTFYLVFNSNPNTLLTL